MWTYFENYYIGKVNLFLENYYQSFMVIIMISIWTIYRNDYHHGDGFGDKNEDSEGKNQSWNRDWNSDQQNKETPRFIVTMKKMNFHLLIFLHHPYLIMFISNSLSMFFKLIKYYHHEWISWIYFMEKLFQPFPRWKVAGTFCLFTQWNWINIIWISQNLL